MGIIVRDTKGYKNWEKIESFRDKRTSVKGFSYPDRKHGEKDKLYELGPGIMFCNQSTVIVVKKVSRKYGCQEDLRTGLFGLLG